MSDINAPPPKQGTAENIAGCVVFLCVLMFLFPLGLWGYQGLQWLKDGVWTPIPTWLALGWMGFREPSSTWAGVQKIIAYVLDMPFAAVAFMVAIGIMLILVQAMDRK